MELKNVKVKELIFAGYNPRKITEQDFEALKKSIKEFGFVEPIVVNKDKTIVGGHMRVQAAKEIGMEEVPCYFVDLDKKREKALNLALNRIIGEWDDVKLAKLVKEISSLDEVVLTGFDQTEIEQLIMQNDLVFSDLESGTTEDDINKIFERSERVGVNVEKPDTMVKKDKIGFYCDTLEQFNTIRKYFKTTRQAQLDIDKLMELINEHQGT